MENPLCRHLSVQELFALPKIPPVVTAKSSGALTNSTATMVTASQQSSVRLSEISKKPKVSVQKIVLVLVICLVAAHVCNEINIRKKSKEEKQLFKKK